MDLPSPVSVAQSLNVSGIDHRHPDGCYRDAGPSGLVHKRPTPHGASADIYKCVHVSLMRIVQQQRDQRGYSAANCSLVPFPGLGIDLA